MGSGLPFAWAFLHSAGILCVSCAADKRGFPAIAQRGSSVYAALQVAAGCSGTVSTRPTAAGAAVGWGKALRAACQPAW